MRRSLATRIIIRLWQQLGAGCIVLCLSGSYLFAATPNPEQILSLFQSHVPYSFNLDIRKGELVLDIQTKERVPEAALRSVAFTVVSLAQEKDFKVSTVEVRSGQQLIRVKTADAMALESGKISLEGFRDATPIKDYSPPPSKKLETREEKMARAILEHGEELTKLNRVLTLAQEKARGLAQLGRFHEAVRAYEEGLQAAQSLVKILPEEPGSRGFVYMFQSYIASTRGLHLAQVEGDATGARTSFMESRKNALQALEIFEKENLSEKQAMSNAVQTLDQILQQLPAR